MIVDQSLKTITAIGSETFVISIAQQASWFAAVCQEKKDGLMYAHVGFSKEPFLWKNADAAFSIDVMLEPPTFDQGGGCWNLLVGSATIVTGFPIPERQYEEQGLEVSVPVMAALAGIKEAISFKGGYIFKGRYHALVPIRTTNDSCQWHFVDAWPKKLDWTYIDRVCPGRVRSNAAEDALKKPRAFLGWCPSVLDFLGKTHFFS